MYLNLFGYFTCFPDIVLNSQATGIHSNRILMYFIKLEVEAGVNQFGSDTALLISSFIEPTQILIDCFL